METDDLEISSRRSDGTLRPFVPIWVVRIGDSGLAQGFRVDVPGPEVSREDIARLFVTSLDLLMTESAVVRNVRIVEESHKGTKGGPSDPR